jgi:hypothetical protein
MNAAPGPCTAPQSPNAGGVKSGRQQQRRGDPQVERPQPDALAAAGRVALLVPQMLARLGAERTFQQALLELLEQPFFAEKILRRAVASEQLLNDLFPDRLCHNS